MISFNFIYIDKKISKGLEMVARVRGFELASSGINVYVEEDGANGLHIVKSDDGYSITYNGQTNLYRACTILCGMLEEDSFEEVHETAKFERCGVMIDCSRNAVLKVDAIKEVFARLAGMGINYAMLYTEDTYEIDNYPYFGYMRGRYSKAELKSIDDTANTLGIELVPCIQTLGHLSVPLKWNAMNSVKDTNDILLIDEPQTYEFIEAMFRSWRECTSAKAIHIGMDEAGEVTKGRYKEIHTEDFDRTDVLIRHLEKVCAIAEKYGFEPMMWSDMFFRFVSNGSYYNTEAEFPEDLKEKIPEGLSLVYWDYSNKKDTVEAMFEKHKELRHEIVFAGGIHTWVGLGVHNKLSFDSMIPSLELCRKNNIKKVFATVWGDNGAEVPFYTVLPGLQLFAEYNYYDNAKHLEKRFKQCTGMEMESFLALELDDLDEEKRAVPWISTSKQVLYNDPLMGLLDKCFENEDMYGIYKKKLERINKVNVPAGMELLFDYYKKLIEVLVIKSQVSKNMLRAYVDKDISVLKKCASDFNDLSEKVRETYNVYVKQWELMNKPFGMEIIDLRFGGLITRLNTATRRLNEFCDGRLAVLEELEEERLYYNRGGVVTSLEKPFVNNHAHLNIITASTV